jgi:hypothetical protein
LGFVSKNTYIGILAIKSKYTVFSLISKETLPKSTTINKKKTAGSTHGSQYIAHRPHGKTAF